MLGIEWLSTAEAVSALEMSAFEIDINRKQHNFITWQKQA